MKLRHVMVCSSNQNRSMEAHALLKREGLDVASYGTRQHVKLPGPSLREPNVYDFGTPYKQMFDELRHKDPEFDGNGIKLSQSENKTPSYVEDASASYNGSSTQPHSPSDSSVAGGGLVFCGGLVGFLFSRNPRTLMSGVLYGGALLALSTLSLKVWRQGKPSFPFILGQAVLSLALLFKHSRAYTLTNKLFPTAFNVVISAAMLCFYAYVMIAGGNPPPKKLNPAAAVETS